MVEQAGAWRGGFLLVGPFYFAVGSAYFLQKTALGSIEIVPDAPEFEDVIEGFYKFVLKGGEGRVADATLACLTAIGS